jgi:response regulator of citrate/malate metabolism
MRQSLKSIYVVEDNADARAMVLDFLSQFNGVQTKGFFTGDACIKDIVDGKNIPDVILMDYYLDSSFASKYDGLDTLSKIVEICPESKIIMFTSVDNERIVKLAKEKGAFDYVVKGEQGFDKLKTILENNFEVQLA